MPLHAKGNLHYCSIGSDTCTDNSYSIPLLCLYVAQVGLLNVDGYYDFLLAFIDKAVDDGFIKPSQRHIFVSAPDARELAQKLEVNTCYSDE